MNEIKSEYANKDRTQFQAALVQKAVDDPSFRAALISDPRNTIREETGLHIPSGINLKVVEESSDMLCLVLPPAEGELSDLELEAVAGGCSGSQPLTHDLRTDTSKRV